MDPLLQSVESRDLTLVPKIVDWFGAKLEEPDAAKLQSVSSEAVRLLSGDKRGQPESEDDVYIVAALADILGLQADAAMIADGNWKQGAWDNYYDDTKDWNDAKTNERFGQLAQCSRPLFGTSIQTTWSYYGYLLHHEVKELLAGLSSTALNHPGIKSPDFIGGFHNELVGWLEEVGRRGTDLWLFAS